MLVAFDGVAADGWSRDARRSARCPRCAAKARDRAAHGGIRGRRRAPARRAARRRDRAAIGPWADLGPTAADLRAAGGCSSPSPALLAGQPAAAAVSLGVQASVAQALLLWPQGLARSRMRHRSRRLVALGAAGGSVRTPARGPHARLGAVGIRGVSAAFLVQVLAATSPVMVVSDEVFHAPTTWSACPEGVVPHERDPHASLPLPLRRLVLRAARAGPADGRRCRGRRRAGAGAAGPAASLGLFALLAPTGAARAGLGRDPAKLLPASSILLFGNLSNVFGQSMTTLFFCWWAGPLPAGGRSALPSGLSASGHFRAWSCSVASPPPW